jgi:hypothetical protein
VGGTGQGPQLSGGEAGFQTQEVWLQSQHAHTVGLTASSYPKLLYKLSRAVDLDFR